MNDNSSFEFKIPFLDTSINKSPKSEGTTLCQAPLKPAEVSEPTSILPLSKGYCIEHITIGTSFTVKPSYAFPKLPQHCDTWELQSRNLELSQAKVDNWFNDSILPGAVVHGNVASPNVVDNTLWTLRGSDVERERNAKEDDFGVDDSHPEEDAVDIFEAVLHYFDKNQRLWKFNPVVLNAVVELMTGFVKNALDEDKDQLKFTLSDVILATVPRIRTDNLEDWDFYPDNAKKYPKQPFDQDFREDDLIAWLQIATVSPFSRLKPYLQHQDNFPITNEHFKRTDEFKDDDLEQAMAEARVFIADFKEFHDANTQKSPWLSFGAKLYTPIALFAIPKHGGPLKTIAIQATQHVPRSRIQRFLWRNYNIQSPQKPLSEIMTPKDDYWSWQMTKTLFLSMYSMSNVIDHLSVHVFLGPIPVSFYRNIPKEHPLTALLETHLLSLVANNHLGIFTEIGSNPNVNSYNQGTNGFLTGLPQKLSGWRGNTFLQATIKKAQSHDFWIDGKPLGSERHLEFSRIDDFPLHDDADIFPIVEQWVDGYLRLYYHSDEDVILDYELQMFCREVSHLGSVNGFPSTVSTMNELIALITRLIYWMAANHGLEGLSSAQKIGPFGYWSQRVPRPCDKKQEKDWFRILPPINVGLAAFCMTRVFVDLPKDWFRSLGKYPQGQFMHDPRIYPLLNQFQQALRDLDDKIQIKNQDRRWEYNLLRPSKLTCSPWN